MPATESPSSFFGTIEEIAAHYNRVMASPAYAKVFSPGADDRRQAKIDATRKRRVRKPTLRTVLRQAARAGVEVAHIQVDTDGSITLTPGAPPDVTASYKLQTAPALDGSEWN
jgi:hypothetical protein